jgi:hypothetical protein
MVRSDRDARGRGRCGGGPEGDAGRWALPPGMIRHHAQALALVAAGQALAERH